MFRAHSKNHQRAKGWGHRDSRAWIFQLKWLAIILWLPSLGCAFLRTGSGSTPQLLSRRNLDMVSGQQGNQPTRPHIVFPGGGLYFYWQAGVVNYLRENEYDLSRATMAGASAGALTATLAAAGVDFYQATELALDLAAHMGVWDRSGGLQGVWGDAIDDWLEDLLPENAVELVEQQELSLLVTRIPSFKKERIHYFSNRHDLIKCNMASVHIPWFLDGQLTTTLRGNLYIDGSFLAGLDLFQSKRPNSPTLVLDHTQDPKLKGKTLFDAVGLLAPEGIWHLLEQGKRHASVMENQGLFQSIPKTST